MIFLLFCLFICLLIFCLHLDTIKPKKYPPGPKWLPILGNFLHFQSMLPKLGYHHLVWSELFHQFGDVVGLKMGRNLIVGVADPQAMREVFMREEFQGRPDGFFFRWRTFGKRLGIVFCEGPFWQKQRKFSLQHLKNFGYGRKEMGEKISDEAKDLIASLKRQCHEPIWMHMAFNTSVINVLWTMIAGQRFNLDDERLKRLMQIIHDAFKAADISGGMLNQMPFLRFIAPEKTGYIKLKNVLINLWKFLGDTIKEHQETFCQSHARDLIDAFLQNMELKLDPTFTNEQLISLCLDLFMAGSETTSNTISFSIAYMIKYPNIQKNVQNELDEMIGRNRWPQLEDRVNLKYTEAVLMEIQRHTNVPPLGIAHRATKTTTLLDHVIPKDTIILTSLYSLHMNEKFWKDPHVFRPERFLETEIDEKYFVPFGCGKRRCLGEMLAKANFFMFFVSVLHNFFIEGVEPVQLEGQDGVTLSPKPFKARLIPRVD